LDVKTPEFNNGFVTALTLFYGHDDSSMRGDVKEGDNDYRLSGGKDHLYEMVIPSTLSDGLRTRIETFREAVFRLSGTSFWKPSVSMIEAVDKLFEECYRILMAIDEEVFGLSVVVRYP